MRTKSAGRLHEIDAAIQQIASFTQGKTEADYLSDSLLRSAVLWQLVRICEPVRSLARDDPEIVQGINRYRQIIGFRTLLIHRYDRVEHDLVWQYVQAALPRLRTDVGALLDAPDGREES